MFGESAVAGWRWTHAARRMVDGGQMLPYQRFTQSLTLRFIMMLGSARIRRKI